MTRTSQAYTRNPKPAESAPLPNRLVRLLSEARWLVLATLSVYLVLILLTYSHDDPGWSRSIAVLRLHNWGGKVGAYSADLLLYVFGLSAWWFCVLCGRYLWIGYRRMSQRFFLEQEVEPEHKHEALLRMVGFVL